MAAQKPRTNQSRSKPPTPGLAAPADEPLVTGNAAQDANLDPAPPPAPPHNTDISTVTATADDPGLDAVLIVGPKEDGSYPYVRVQPFGVAIGESVQVQTVPDRDDVRAIYVDGRWIKASVDLLPPVTNAGK